MIERVLVRRGVYHDSVTLMLASQRASAVDGLLAVGNPPGPAYLAAITAERAHWRMASI